MKVQIVDPSAFTPPYDRALAAALAARGAEVELLTSRFLHGEVPPAQGFAVRELFYRRSAERGMEAPARRAFKLAEHLPDMLRLRGAVAQADVVHYQWLTVPALDASLLPPRRPRLLTAHYVAPPRAGAARRRLARRAFSKMDAVVAHSEHGARRLREELGLDAARVRVVHHGALDYLTRLAREAPLPDELDEAGEAPVVLFFGLLRPYKGLEVLLEAFEDVPGAELWVVGNPRMDVRPLRAAAASSGRIRLVPRFVDEAEVPALFRRADLVVLPYLDAEHSGVLYTALAFGKPLVMSSVGGFPEVAAHGAGRLVPPGDAPALAAALRELVGDESQRAELASAAASAAAGPYSWDEAARLTLELYEELLERRR